MTAQRSTSPLDAQSSGEGNIRKRVCKACDRCRLKKSKCDGASPCGRCKTDNAICVFGERKKAHDKVYPKGYVEMLEQQQNQLVSGIQELYRRALEGEGWPGSPLKASSNGHPLTHDILERLGALKQEGSTENESFEEDLNVVQQRLLSNGAGLMQRQDSSDGGSSNGGDESSPTFTTKGMFQGEPYSTAQFPPTPPNYSPYPRSSQQHPAAAAAALSSATTPKFQTPPAAAPRQHHHHHPHPHSQPHCIPDPSPLQTSHPPQPPFFHHKQQQQQQTHQPTVGQMFFPGPHAAAAPPHDNIDPAAHHTHSLSRQPSWSQFSDNMFDDSMDLFRGFDAQQPPQQTASSLSLDNNSTSTGSSSNGPSSMDYLPHLQRTTGATTAAPFPRATAVPSGLNSCLGQPDWNDEDFKAFFNPSPSLLS